MGVGQSDNALLLDNMMLDMTTAATNINVSYHSSPHRATSKRLMMAALAWENVHDGQSSMIRTTLSLFPFLHGNQRLLQTVRFGRICTNLVDVTMPAIASRIRGQAASIFQALLYLHSRDEVEACYRRQYFISPSPVFK
jgi:hypothetical protein